MIYRHQKGVRYRAVVVPAALTDALVAVGGVVSFALAVTLLVWSLSGCSFIRDAEERIAAKASDYIATYCSLSAEERAAAQGKIDAITAPYVLRVQDCEPEGSN